MTVLVTGAAGFIGSHVTEALLRRGDTVVGIDNLNAYYPTRFKWENLALLKKKKRFQFFQLDFTRQHAVDDIFRRYRFDRVVHLGARAGVRPSLQRPSLYAHVNIGGTVTLLDAASRTGVKQFLFASSSSVYGATTPVPFSETAVLGIPESPYALTKRVAEHWVEYTARRTSMPCTVVRLFTVYGPRGRPDMAPYLFTRAILRGEPITLFGDGTSRRDYTYVADAVRGIIAALGRPKPFRVYNIGNSHTHDLRTLVRLIERATKCTATFVWRPTQRGDVPRTWASIRRARRELGYRPTTALAEGIDRFVSWYRRVRR